MEKKTNFTFQIIMVAIACIIGLTVCFLKYSFELEKDYERQMEEELKYNTAMSIEAVNTKVDDITNLLINIRDALIYQKSDFDINYVNGFLQQESDKYGLGNLSFVYSADFSKVFVSHDKYMRNFMKGQSIVYSDTISDKDSFKVGVAVPVFQNSKLIGVICNEYSSGKIYKLFGVQNFSNDAHAYIISSTGYVFQKSGGFKEDNCIKMLEDAEFYNDYSSEQLKRDMLYKKSAILHYSSNGQEYYAYATPCNINTWYMYSIVPAKKIEASAERMKRLAFILSFAVMTIVLLFASSILFISNEYTKRIKQSKRELEFLTDNIPGGVVKFVAFPDFRLIYANDGYYELIGYTKEEYDNIFGTGNCDFIYSDDLLYVKNAVRNNSDNKSQISLEFRVVQKNGSIAWVMLNGEKTGIEDGNAIYQGVVFENTANKTASLAVSKTKRQLETVTNSIDGGVLSFMCDDKMQIVYSNDGYYALAGFDRKELSNNFFEDAKLFIHANDLNYVTEKLQHSIKNKSDIEIEFRILRNKAEVLWIHCNGHCIINDDGNDTFLCIWVDITEYKKTSEELEHITNNILGGVAKFECDNDLTLLFASDGFYAMLGYTKEEYKEICFDKNINTIHPDDIEYARNILVKNNKLGESVQLEYRILTKNGNYIWALLNGSFIEIDDGRIAYYCIISDYTSNKMALQQIEIQKETYDIIADMSDEVLFEYDIEKDELNISNKFEDTFKTTINKKEFIKKLYENPVKIHPNDRKAFFGIYEGITSVNPKRGMEIRILNDGNEYVWASFKGVSISDSSGAPIKFVGKVSNINEEKMEIEALREKSTQDPLTKVFNKLATSQNINSFLDNEGKFGTHALMILDIDNFKSFNDNFGHMFGDAVLVRVTSNIKMVFGEKEIVGRIGGDEFAVLIKDVTDATIEAKANRICGIFRNTYTGENNDNKISCSIGVAVYPYDGFNYNELLQKADMALYSAKSKGKDRFERYMDKKSLN